MHQEEIGAGGGISGASSPLTLLALTDLDKVGKEIQLDFQAGNKLRSCFYITVREWELIVYPMILEFWYATELLREFVKTLRSALSDGIGIFSGNTKTLMFLTSCQLLLMYIQGWEPLVESVGTHRRPRSKEYTRFVLKEEHSTKKLEIGLEKTVFLMTYDPAFPFGY